jgi:hypothetical protein
LVLAREDACLVFIVEIENAGEDEDEEYSCERDGSESCRDERLDER